MICPTKNLPLNGHRDRRGSVTVLMALAIVGILAFAAFAIDVGYLLMARSQIQNSADAAAMAAAWSLLDERRLQDNGMYEVEWDARTAAYKYANGNKVAGDSPSINLNLDNSSDGDVQFGKLTPDHHGNLTSASVMDVNVTPDEFNAVRVLVQRTASTNGEVSLFFGRIFGRNTSAVQAEATAVFRDGLTGFKSKSHVPFTSLLPFTMKITDWQALEAGAGTDDFDVDSGNDTVSSGGDGVAEGKMFPERNQGGGITPGNFGTIDIGHNNNSTADLVRQITEGVSSSDLAAMPDGKLDAGMTLDGETGLSIGIKEAVASIIGQERTIPLYDTVEGTGDTAGFHIVGFAGIRIVDVQLTGKNIYIQIQPAVVVDDSAYSDGGDTDTYQVFGRVVLIK